MGVICSACKKDKEIGDFHANKRKANGLSSSCKECSKAYVRRFRGSNGSDRRLRSSSHVKAYKTYMKRQVSTVKAVAKIAENLAMRARDFAKRVSEVHPGKGYEVDILSFRAMEHPVTISCPLHGDHTFSKARNVVHQGSECPLCSNGSKAKAHKVYLVEIEVSGDRFAKIGISRDTEKRFDPRYTGNPGVKLLNIVEEIETENYEDAREIERSLLSIVNRHPADTQWFKGHTETGRISMIPEAIKAFREVREVIRRSE